jgi:AcrR family transcriptional regulator
VPHVRTQQIVEAALRVFTRKGVHQSSVDDIVAEAGVSKGLLYLYFKGKEALIEAVMKRLFAPDFQIAQRLLNDNETVAVRLREYVRSFACDVGRYRTLLPLFHECYSMLGRNRRMRELVADYYARQENFFRKMVLQGIVSGELRVCDAETVAVSLLALQEGLIMRWMMQPETTDWSAQAEESLNLLLRGLEENN